MAWFEGHVVPGTAFIVIGAWWTFQIWRKYMQSQPRGGFRCQASYPPECWKQKLDVEGFLVFCGALLGIVWEIFFANILVGNRLVARNWQHCTMFFFFGFSGFIAVLAPVLRKLFLNPEDVEDIKIISLAMAFAVEALLFKFHLHGRDMLDTTLHTLLLYAVYGCVMMCLFELGCRDKVLVSLGRAFFMILQGTWLWQIGLVLYNPYTKHSGWDHENHEHVMLSTCMYTWHACGAFLWVLGTGVAVAMCNPRRGGVLPRTRDRDPGENGYKHLSYMGDDEEEDEEQTTKLIS